MSRMRRLSSHNWLVHLVTERELERVFPKYLRGRLVDIGCGLKPYEALARPYVTEHIGLDEERSRHGTSRVDVTGTAYAIPFPNSSFDSVLCSSVLEHLEEPELALREINRVLRASGHAVFTVPMLWQLHEEPRDFYRFTKHGLAYLLNKSGFDVVELVPLSGFWLSFGQMLAYVLQRKNRGVLRATKVLPILGAAIQGISLGLDTIDRYEQWTCAYLAVARKRQTQ